MLVNKLARAITKWTSACDKRLARLISCIHHACEFKQFCHVGNTAQQCRLELFQDSDFEETLKTQNQHQEGSCVFSEVTRLCQQVGCARNRLQFHTSLDAGLRMDGIHALTLWDLLIEVFHSNRTKQKDPSESYGKTRQHLSSQTCTTRSQIKHTNVIPTNIDHIPSNTKNSDSIAILYVFDDSDAATTMRHVSRTHRVALDWLQD